MKHYSEDVKKQVLDEVSQLKNVSLVARKYEIPITTIHAWIVKRNKNLKKGILKDEKTSQNEILNLKKKLNKKELEVHILRDLLKKTFQVWDTE